jgi:sensor domain CHASE-containing protein
VSLRRTTFIAVLLAALGLFTLLVALSRIVLMDRFERVEGQQAQASVARAKAVVDRLISRIDVSTLDYASWDDMYAFMESRDPKFIESNFAYETFKTLELSFRAILDEKGVTLLEEWNDTSAQAATPFPPELAGRIREAGLAEHAAAGRSVSGLLRFGDYVALVAARPMLTSDHQGPVRGGLIFGRILGETDLHVVATLADVTPRVMLAGPDTPTDGSVAVRPVSATRIAAQMNWTAGRRCR